MAALTVATGYTCTVWPLTTVILPKRFGRTKLNLRTCSDADVAALIVTYAPLADILVEA